jgi:hypothetical protein
MTELSLLAPPRSTRTAAAGSARPEAVAAGVGACDVSVIVPVTERPEPFVELYREYAAPLFASGRSVEFIFAISPNSFASPEPLVELAEQGEPVRFIEAARSVGETALVRAALKLCRGRIVVTLPAYRRVQPEAILDLIARVEDGVDVAIARRWPRRDPLVNRLQHRVLHMMIGPLAGGSVHDVGSGVRALTREAFEDIPLYGDFLRFLPLLAVYRGYSVEEVKTAQHPQDMRARVYRPGVYARRVIDLFGMYFLLRFMDKPLRFFGLAGATLSSAGLLILGVLTFWKAVGDRIGDRPILLLGVLLLTLGIQAIALGLIGEMIVHFNASGRRAYRLRSGPGTPSGRVG